MLCHTARGTAATSQEVLIKGYTHSFIFDRRGKDTTVLKLLSMQWEPDMKLGYIHGKAAHCPNELFFWLCTAEFYKEMKEQLREYMKPS